MKLPKGYMIRKKKDNFLRLKKAPLITIAITCFNAEKTIERAILSALNQDWPNFEVIIIDDASNDSSKEIIKKYESKIKNLQFYNQKINNGCAKARNILISKAKGEFIAFFDDDDFSHSDRLSLQFEHLIGYEKSINKINSLFCLRRAHLSKQL